MRAMQLALLVLTLAALAAPAHAQLSAASPGRLAAAHARLEKQCGACHVPFGGVPAKQCLTCHTTLASRLAADRGYHASVKGEPCASCHREHQGRDAALAPPPPESFRHATTGFPLEGEHAALGCEACHGGGKTRRRWLGIATSCKSCHADRAHRGALGSKCEACHTARGWHALKITQRDHRTPTTGGHAALGCASCHRSGLRLTSEPQACAQCHRRAHRGTTAPCETCHQVESFRALRYTHAFSWQALPGKHQSAPCLACHPGFTFRASLECASCHERQRPHEPLGACETCHSATAWKELRFDHSRVDFPLTGAHQRAPCAGCHPRQGQFRGAPRTCEQCHDEAHRGQFGVAPSAPSSPAPGPVAGPAPAVGVAAPAAPAAPAAQRRVECARCHTTAAWAPSTIDAAAHGARGYPLRGAHATARCASCHQAGVYVGVARRCNACHVDLRHRGRLGDDCATCHTETGWAPAARFDHARTGFALEGSHAKPTCERCHGGDGKRLLDRAEPTACRTCHAPTRHGDQLGERCAQCHRPTSFREVPRFDHARTDFPLELRHATLPCLTCHDTAKRARVNPACRTCHGDPHRASNGFECLDCHRSDRWRIIRFDHDLTAYPLTGKHRLAGCGGCHTNPNWTGVRTDCVACHAFDRPRTEDHPPELACDDCHSPADWRAVLPGARP